MIPSVSVSAVLVPSESLPDDVAQCRGFDFDTVVVHNNHEEANARQGTGNDSLPTAAAASLQCSMRSTLDSLMESFLSTGFQATNVALAIQQIQQMRSWRLSDVPYQHDVDDAMLQDLTLRQKIRARIFLAYTSNQISSGQREIIKFLVQHKMVDVVITTAGGIEEDIIKCLCPTYIGDFHLNGRTLRQKGINRLGNLLIPNHNYCVFEDWVTPIIHQMHNEQDQATIHWANTISTVQNDQGSDINNSSSSLSPLLWTPSKIIHRLGQEINHPDSVLYWASQNNIPIFCPALTDGSLGDMLYFHSYQRPGFIIDIHHDIRHLNDIAVKSYCTGQIILGGGLVKHHCCNANLMRNGANYSVYINTGQEYDGSDTGASPDEAISWGKIRMDAQPVKVCADATIVFPLIVSQTFAKENLQQWEKIVNHTFCHIDDIPIPSQK
jgi:deoxyhypusine synthase